jgi:hypothetical protein
LAGPTQENSTTTWRSMLFSAIAVGGAGGALWLMQNSALAEQAKPAETQFPEGPFERGVSSGTAVLAASASATEDCVTARCSALGFCSNDPMLQSTPR